MPTKIGFDYTSIAPEQQKVIADHAKAITMHLRHSTRSTIDIGQRMIQVKELLGPVFGAWIRAEFEWSLRSVGDYMRLAKRFGDLDCIDSFQPTALLALCKKHIPQAAVDQAVAVARSGQMVTHAFASELADRIVLEQFSMNVGPSISSIKVSQTAARMAERVRPTSIRKLQTSVATMLKNMQSVYESISESDRKSLADELMELAKQLIQEPVVEGDVETTDQRFESETVAFHGKQQGRRELAHV